MRAPRAVHALLAAAALAVAAAAVSGVAPRAAAPEEAAPAPAPGRFALRLLASDPAGGGDGAISPAGDAFVTSSRRTGDWELWLFDLRTGEWRQLTDSPGDDFEAQWSPDGRRLVFTSTRTGQKDVWTLSLDDGALTRLTDSEHDDEYPQWSPDGRTIVYTGGAWGENHFFVVPAAGGTPRRVTRTPGRAGACAFAHDSRSLVCHRYSGESGDVLHLTLDGLETRVTSGPAWDYKPTQSPDGRWIAFTRTEEGPSAIWVIPSGGGEGAPLAGSGFSDRWPGWTAAGDAIFFHRVVDRGRSVRLLDRSTGRVRELVGAEERPLQASLDAAGRRLAYCVQHEGRRGIRVRDLETGEVRDLGDPARSACWPRWSPDGRTLAFALRGARRWEVATMDADGSGLRVWTEGTPGRGGMDGPLDWSPDGRFVAFKRDTEPFESDLFVLDVADGTLRNLTQDRWFDEGPSWSADGGSLLYMSTRGGGWTWGLYRLSVADGTVSVVSPPEYVEKNFPREDAAGAVVWAYRDPEGVERLAERPSRGGEGVEVPRAGEGARWPSYTRDGRYLLYTRMEHLVEYWVAEHPAGEGSPLAAAEPARPAYCPTTPGAAARRLAAAPSERAPRLLHDRLADVRLEWGRKDRTPADKFRR